MNKHDFYFQLPPELIAQYPLPQRGDSRLLVYHRQTQRYEHARVNEICSFLQPGDLLVMNDSRVIPARLYATKETGGKAELLIERLTGTHSFLAHIKVSKALKSGSVLYLEKEWRIKILAKHDDLYACQVEGDLDKMLEQVGHIPLPPYINRHDDEQDAERYQTVYAQHKGSVAVPTAGLHFDQALIEELKNKGIKIAFSTLHVGAGTFRPVRCEDIQNHKMHREQFVVSEELCHVVNSTRAKKGRVIAVGTTALRSLESAAQGGILKPCRGDTDIFIYPGYTFQICDGLMTNFHLPESTLLMLVSAFMGHTQAMNLYQEAISNGYRFFSYGDTSLLI